LQMPNEEESIEEKGLMMRWCIRAHSVGAEKAHLSAEEFSWVNDIVTTPPNLLTPLAEEHVRHVRNPSIIFSFWMGIFLNASFSSW
jgi:hypothetical protein